MLSQKLRKINLKKLISLWRVCINKLETQMKDKVLDLLSKKENLNDDIRKLEDCHKDVIHQIEFSSKPKLIQISDHMVSFIRGVSNQVTSQNSSFDPVSIEFASDVAPEYKSGQFEILNYLDIKESKEIIYSESLISNGISWRLKVYPNGNGQAKDHYLSVFLEMMKGYSISAKYDYKIEMENPSNCENKVSREYTSEFEVGECWGYNRFYKSECIVNEGFLTEDGSLKLNYFVRASTFSQQCIDQNNYISQLEKQMGELKSKLIENNIQFSDDEKDEKSEDELDTHPMSDLKGSKDYTSEEETEDVVEETTDKILQKGLDIFRDSNEENKHEIDHINEDSMQADDEYALDSSNNEEAKHKDYEADELAFSAVANNNRETEEIENHIDEFSKIVSRGRELNFIKQMKSRLKENSSSPEERGKAHDDESAKIEAFLKEMNDTEQQIKILKIYNKSFNREMSERFGGYDFHSDESYEIKDSSSSDGDLSRDEEVKFNKKKSKDVSPETVIESIHKAKSELIKDNTNLEVSDRDNSKNQWKNNSLIESKSNMNSKMINKNK